MIPLVMYERSERNVFVGIAQPLELLFIEDLACKDKSCAPPPIGTGGSNPGSGSGGRLAISVSAAGQSADIESLTPKSAKDALEVFTGRVTRGKNPRTIPPIPGMENVKTLAEAVDAVEAQINATIDTALANGYTKEMAQSAAHWYPVGNHYLGQLTSEYGYRFPETGAAIAAALSPSAEWGSNVTNARVVMELVNNNPVITEDHITAYRDRIIRALEGKLKTKDKPPEYYEKVRSAIERAKNPERLDRLRRVMIGRRFNEINVKHAAVLAQAHVQDNQLKTTAFVVSPDGRTYTVGGTKNKAIVQSLPNTIKALEIARADKRGASEEEMLTVIDAISGESKVRAFYMNLAYPRDRTQDATTIDTHALGSLLGTPFNSTTAKPYFSSFTEKGRSTYSPAYPVYRAALGRVMKRLETELGITPGLARSAAQSVVWEMERYLLPEDPKGKFLGDPARRQTLTEMKRNGSSPLEVKQWIASQMGGARDRMEPPIENIKEYSVG